MEVVYLNISAVIALGFFLMAPFSALAVGKTNHRPVVAVVSLVPPNVEVPQMRGLIDGLVEAGYVDGDRVSLLRIVANDEAWLRSALSESLRRPLDAIVTGSAVETVAAKSLTSQISIVFAPARDPVAAGFVKSLAQPATNLTGLSYSRGAEDSAKQLAVFKQMWPTLKRVMLFYPASGTPAATLQALRRAALVTKTEISERPIERIADAERAAVNASRATTDGILSVCSSQFRAIKQLTAVAERSGLPVFGCTAAQVAEEGALLTYAPDLYYLGYRGAWYVDRILKGTKPQQLPVELPSKFELMINLKVAERLGIKIPPQMLILADKVFS